MWQCPAWSGLAFLPAYLSLHGNHHSSHPPTLSFSGTFLFNLFSALHHHHHRRRRRRHHHHHHQHHHHRCHRRRRRHHHHHRHRRHRHRHRHRLIDQSNQFNIFKSNQFNPNPNPIHQPINHPHLRRRRRRPIKWGGAAPPQLARQALQMHQALGPAAQLQQLQQLQQLVDLQRPSGLEIPWRCWRCPHLLCKPWMVMDLI